MPMAMASRDWRKEDRIPAVFVIDEDFGFQAQLKNDEVMAFFPNYNLFPNKKKRHYLPGEGRGQPPATTIR